MQPVSPWQALLLPVVAVVANDVLGAPLFDGVVGAYALLAFGVASYVHFAMVSAPRAPLAPSPQCACVDAPTRLPVRDHASLRAPEDSMPAHPALMIESKLKTAIASARRSRSLARRKHDPLLLARCAGRRRGDRGDGDGAAAVDERAARHHRDPVQRRRRARLCRAPVHESAQRLAVARRLAAARRHRVQLHGRARDRGRRLRRRRQERASPLRARRRVDASLPAANARR